MAVQDIPEDQRILWARIQVCIGEVNGERQWQPTEPLDVVEVDLRTEEVEYTPESNDLLAKVKDIMGDAMVRASITYSTDPAAGSA